MAYSFSLTDSGLQAALRRIAAEELGAAVSKLDREGAPAPATVHEVRKHIKKMRGLLRLFRRGFADHAAENAALRDAAARLSLMRDAEVRLATFDRLTARDRPEDLAPIRALLAADRDESGDPDGMRLARDELAAVLERSAGWKLKGKDGPLLARGLAETRSRALEALKAAEKSREPEALHELRKRVKDGWYQARLMVPVWPVVMTPLADQAGILADDLGDHHDVAVLAAHMAAMTGLSPEIRSEAARRAGEEQARLEARIFPLCETLLAGKPEGVARQWVSWWKIWRAT